MIENQATCQGNPPPQIIIPLNSQFQAIQNDDPNSRKENQRIINQLGQQKWQTQTNYGRRAKAENTLSRFKIIIGNKIKSHNPKAKKNEVHIVILILNQMYKMGMPKAQIAA